MRPRTTVSNFVLFQLGWFACVLSAAALQPWLGALAVLAIVGFHLWRATRPRAELLLLLAAVMIGTAWDSLLVALDWLRYSSGMLLPWAAPYWIIGMWALFATTLNVSLRWLRGRLLGAALLGAIAGPLAYLAGQRLGAVEIPLLWPALPALALGWALFTPLLVQLAQRWDGYAAMTPDMTEDMTSERSR